MCVTVIFFSPPGRPSRRATLLKIKLMTESFFLFYIVILSCFSLPFLLTFSSLSFHPASRLSPGFASLIPPSSASPVHLCDTSYHHFQHFQRCYRGHRPLPISCWFWVQWFEVPSGCCVQARINSNAYNLRYVYGRVHRVCEILANLLFGNWWVSGVVIRDRKRCGFAVESCLCQRNNKIQCVMLLLPDFITYNCFFLHVGGKIRSKHRQGERQTYIQVESVWVCIAISFPFMVPQSHVLLQYVINTELYR